MPVSPEQPNVVLLVLDTVRARNASGYGHDRPTTPELDSIAASGTRYVRTTSTSPWTLPSHASLFTGVPPSVHRTNSLDSELPSKLPTLPGTLSRAGYRTVGFATNPWLSSLFGVTRGFDDFSNLAGPFNTDSYRQFTMLLTDESLSLRRRTQELLRSQSPGELVRNGLTAGYRKVFDRDDEGGRLAVNKAKDVIDGPEPFFLFVNFLEPHLPYDPPEGYERRFVPDGIVGERLEALNHDSKAYNVRNISMDDEAFDLLERLYDAEIRYTDELVGELFDYLDERGMLDETLFIVTSDHGENIGDHGLMGHNYSLNETVLNVPLVVHYPGRFDCGDVVERRVSSLDIPATIVDVLSDAGLDLDEFAASQKGRSLDDAPDDDRAVYAEYLNPVPPIEQLEAACENPEFDVSRYDHSLRAVLKGDWKYLEGSDGRRELYDLSTDPGETTNRHDANEDVTAELASLLRAWTSSHTSYGETVDESEKLKAPLEDRLEKLGYL